MKTMASGYRVRTTTIRDANSNLIKDEQAIMERWAEYFEELLSKDNYKTTKLQNNEEVDAIEGNVSMPTLEEVEKHIKKQSFWKQQNHSGAIKTWRDTIILFIT